MDWPRRIRLAMAAVTAIVAPMAGVYAQERRTENVAPKDHAYRYEDVTKEEFAVGAESFWIFEPARPKPAKAPVIVFNHGWLAMNPGVYGAWIEHLVKSGNIVIYPRYQDDASTNPDEFRTNALAAIKGGFDVLQTSEKHVKPEPGRFAIIGHSAGGNLALQIAAAAEGEGLPEPKAVIAVMPGEVKPKAVHALERLPKRMLLVIAVGDADLIVGDALGRRLFAEAEAVPAARKTFVMYRSDYHGYPPLIANHFAPTAVSKKLDTGEGPFYSLQVRSAELNALDRAGYWRLTDLTLAAAFSGKTLMEVTDDGASLRTLGYWSDGKAVQAPLVGSDPSAFPRVLAPNGARLIDFPLGMQLKRNRFLNRREKSDPAGE